ncbi:MAG: hypothetical protein ACXWVX_09685 [Sulfuricurvum sp.]
MKKYIFIAIYFSSCFSFAIGSEGVGGGASKQIESNSVQFLLENGDLKMALLNYLKTLKVDQIPNSSMQYSRIKSLFQFATQENRIQKDIMTPHNYVFNQGCPKTQSFEDNFACTKIGDIYGPINFEVDKIAEYYKSLSTEQLMIRLGSLVLHEHIHHFQNPNIAFAENEADAYLVSDYVKVTAKIAQTPLLKWTPAQSTPELGEALSVVKYYDIKDSNSKNAEFIKVTKTKDYRLLYERCFDANQCIAISDRKLNLVEAWTWGNHVSQQKSWPYYLTGLALAPIVGIVAFGSLWTGGLVLALGVVPWGSTIMIGCLAAEGFIFHKINSALGKSTRVAYVAVQDNNMRDVVIVQDRSISELVIEIKNFINEAPKLPVSIQALKEWDENNPS